MPEHDGSRGSTRPLASLLLIAFNQQDTIAEAIAGALAQSYSPLEILVSDDASTDGTYGAMQAALAGYDGPHRVLLNRNPANLGIGAHLSQLVSLSHGELLFVAAGDDVSLPQRCERVVEAWLASGKRLDLIASALVDIDTDGKTHAQIVPSDLATYRNAADWIARPPHVIGAAQAWTRRVFDRFGPLPSGVVAEDLIMVFRAIVSGGALTLTEPQVRYRRGGLSRKRHALSAAQVIERWRANSRHSLVELPLLLHDARLAGQLGAVEAPLKSQLARETLVRDLFGTEGWTQRAKLLLRASPVPQAQRIRFAFYALCPVLLAPLFAAKRLRWSLHRRERRPIIRREPMPADLVFSNHGLRHSGGIERYLLTLVDALHARGVRPTVVAHRFDRTLPEFDWVDPILIRTWGLGGALRDLWFDRQLRRLKHKLGLYPLVALSQTSAADIAISGGTHPGFLAAMERSAGWKDRLAIALERRHFAGAALVVAHSRLMMEQVCRFYGVAPTKVQVLYPPVDTARFHAVDAAQRRALRESLGLPNDRPVFLLASTGHARKGLDLAVEAIGHSNLPVLLVVAGRPTGLRAPNLRELGFRTDMEDVYRAVDCTVMASRFEPFGLVGVESVLCGTPLIGEAAMGCMEVIREPAAIPFRIDLPGSLQSAIAAALTRWRAGSLSVPDPRAALAYDPSVDIHLDALLTRVAALRKARQGDREATPP